MFPYNEYLQLAKQWATENDEAHMRCAVSRAYYACFHFAKEFAEKKGEIFKGTGFDHDIVIAFLGNNPDGDISVLSSTQIRLKKDRIKSDYYKSIQNIKSITEKAILNAENIFSVLKNKI